MNMKAACLKKEMFARDSKSQAIDYAEKTISFLNNLKEKVENRSPDMGDDEYDKTVELITEMFYRMCKITRHI